MSTTADEPVALSSASAVVLGLLAAGTAQTTYELKAAIETSIGYFWPFPSSQLYAETKRLEAAGFITGEQEEFGRRRRLHRITPAGRDALAAWLTAVTDRHTEIRDIGLLKLFLSDAVPDFDIGGLVERQLALHRSRLAEYRAIAAAYEGSTSASLRTLALGIAFEEVAIEFWEGSAPAGP